MNFDEQRRKMVEGIASRGVKDRRVLDAMAKVPRHLFVPEEFRERSYEDKPCPIGAGQTISQPTIVAMMTEQLNLTPSSKVLEVGTGSGYQTAILCELAGSVYSIERLPMLAERATKELASLGYKNVKIRVGDGSSGWPEEAPFHAVIAAASAPLLPEPLILQLAEKGRLVLPIGEPDNQMLLAVEKSEGRIMARDICKCLFVPLVGRHGWKEGSVTEVDGEEPPK
jgi:protein-L-isoaspartate(D-aspartate) O-methyltransferase